MKRITLYFNVSVPKDTEEKLLGRLRQTVPELMAPEGLCRGMDVSIEACEFTNYTFARGKMIEDDPASRQWSFKGDPNALPVVFGHVVVHLQAMQAKEQNMEIELQYNASAPIIYIYHKPIRKQGDGRSGEEMRQEFQEWNQYRFLSSEGGSNCGFIEKTKNIPSINDIKNQYDTKNNFIDKSMLFSFLK